MTPRHAAAPSSDTTLRTRYGSTRQITKANGMATTTEIAATARTVGNIINKNANVSASMIMTSTKLAVVQRTSNLKREIAIRVTNIGNDSTAERPGRRNKTSQKKFTNPHAAMNMAIRATPVSVATAIANAAK